MYNNETTIFVRTTENYTLEDDLVRTGSNCKVISTYFKIENDVDVVSDFLKNSKANNMLDLCIAIEDLKILIEVPKHISEIIENLQ